MMRPLLMCLALFACNPDPTYETGNAPGCQLGDLPEGSCIEWTGSLYALLDADELCTSESDVPLTDGCPDGPVARCTMGAGTELESVELFYDVGTSLDLYEESCQGEFEPL